MSDKLTKLPSVELSFDQADRVLRRALEIQQRDEGKHSISLLEVEAMASELGVPADTVRSAYREVRSQALVPVPRRRALDLLIGDAKMRVSRTLEGQPAAQVQERVRTYLEEQLFRLKRNLGDRTIWEPATGLGNSIRRAIDFADRIELPTAMELEVLVLASELNPEHSDVIIVADFRGAQGETALATGIGATLLTGGSVALGLLVTPFALGLAPVFAVGSLAVGRRTFATDTTKVRDALERLLDQIQYGE